MKLMFLFFTSWLVCAFVATLPFYIISRKSTPILDELLAIDDEMRDKKV